MTLSESFSISHYQELLSPGVSIFCEATQWTSVLVQ